MDPAELKQRTLNFAVRIIKFAQYLEQDCGNAGRIISRQIIRSGTGVYSNYRAACRCKSAKDFISKMGTVVEEADETLGWIELSVASDLVKRDKDRGSSQRSRRNNCNNDLIAQYIYRKLSRKAF